RPRRAPAHRASERRQQRGRTRRGRVGGRGVLLPARSRFQQTNRPFDRVIDTMRLIEVRRHSLTKKGEGRGKGSHLSPEGVALARKIGGGIGPLDLVLTHLAPPTPGTPT